jgi:hypothetical protein
VGFKIIGKQTTYIRVHKKVSRSTAVHPSFDQQENPNGHKLEGKRCQHPK